MPKLYSVGTPKQKKIKWDLMLGFAVIVIVASAYIVFRIYSKSTTLQVDNTNNTPQTKVIGATTTEQTPIDEELFKMTLPGSWDVWEEQGGHVEGQVYRYKALGDKDNGRYIEVYVNSLPDADDLYMTHMLPIEADPKGTKMTFGEISDLCRKFAPIEETQLVGVVKARWKNIEFDCDVHRYRNIVGTANGKDGYQVSLGSDPENQNKYFFHYTDSGAKPNNSYLQDIIRTFEAK
jgi:hypothetical protein